MAILKIICDASLNQVTQVAGYSGFIEISDGPHVVKEIFNGSRVGTLDVSMVEALAIEHGLKSLRTHIARLSTEVEHLTIFSDSASSIDQIQRSLNEVPLLKQPSRVIKSIAKIIKEDFKNANCHIYKVTAHVPSDKATRIEKEHNEVDKNAVAYRKLSEKGMIKSKLKTGNKALIILPDVIPQLETMKYRNLGLHLGLKGFMVDVVGGIKDPDKNALLLGLNDCKQDYVDGLQFYRHLTKEGQVNHVLSNKRAPHRLIIDLSKGGDVSLTQQLALNTVKESTIIKKVKNLNGAFVELNINEKLLCKQTHVKLKHDISDIILGYNHQVSDDQLVNMIEQLLSKHDVLVDEGFSSDVKKALSTGMPNSRLLSTTLSLAIDCDQKIIINNQNKAAFQNAVNNTTILQNKNNGMTLVRL